MSFLPSIFKFTTYCCRFTNPHSTKHFNQIYKIYMHSATQIIAQRVTPAARSKPRWQPYNCIPASAPNRSPPPSIHLIPKDLQRDNLKNKFAAGLVGRSISALCQYIYLFHYSDQAVKTLSEVWRIQDIPAAFLPPPSQSATAAIKSLSQKHPCFHK